MSEYTLVEWTDEVLASTPAKYILIDDVNGTLGESVTIALVTGLTTVGKPLTATNLNHMDAGIKQAQDDANAAQATADLAMLGCDLAEYLDDLKDVPIELSLNAGTALTTNDKAPARIPAKLDGATLVDIAGSCVGPSSSGAVTLILKKLIGETWTTMLSVNITIDEGERDSITAAVPPQIGAGNTVAEGDQIMGEVVAAGTGVTYCRIQPVFRPAAMA